MQGTSVILNQTELRLCTACLHITPLHSPVSYKANVNLTNFLSVIFIFTNFSSMLLIFFLFFFLTLSKAISQFQKANVFPSAAPKPVEDQETICEYRAIGRACQNELPHMGSVPCRALLWSQTGTGSNSPLLCDCFMQLPNVFPSECPQHQDLAPCYCKPLSLSSSSKKEAEKQVLLKTSSLQHDQRYRNLP